MKPIITLLFAASLLMFTSCGDNNSNNSNKQSQSSEEVYGTYLPESIYVKLAEHTGDNEILAIVTKGNKEMGIKEDDSITVICKDNCIANDMSVLDESSLTLNEVGQIELNSVPVGTILWVEFEKSELNKDGDEYVIDTDWQIKAIEDEGSKNE